MGAIRLTTKFVGEGWTGPVETSVYKQIKQYAEKRIVPLKGKVRELGARRAWGSSGTIINLAEIANKLFKKNGNEKCLTISRKNLKKLALILCSLPLKERKKLPAINPDRADIIIAGAATIESYNFV